MELQLHGNILTLTPCNQAPPLKAPVNLGVMMLKLT